VHPIKRFGWLPVILLVAAALKILTFMGLAEGDDLYYTQLADRAAHGDFTAGFIFDVRWLVYLPTALLYSLFGVNDVTSLLPPIVASMLSVFLAYRIVEAETDTTTAAISTLLYCSLPIILIYANLLQVAPFLEFSTLGSAFFLQRGVRFGRRFDFALSGLFLGLVSLTRITGLFVAPLLLLYLFARSGWNRRSRIEAALLTGVAAIPLLFQGLVYAAVHDDFFHRFRLSREVVAFQQGLQGVDSKDLFFYARTLFLEQDFADFTYFGLLGFLAIPALLYILFSKPGRTGGARVFAVWFGLYFALITFAPTSFSPYSVLVRNIRYAIVLVLPLCACLAWVLARFASKNKGLATASVGLLIMLVAVNVFFSWQKSERFRSRRNLQKEAAQKVLREFPDQKIYLADLNIDRRLAYYSGYTFKDYQKIGSFREMREPGIFLILKMGYNQQRYLIPQAQLRQLMMNPPVWCRYLGDYGYFYVYEVGPPGRE
jgi:4-amino-4-deoxy-L-arabinose transferase-like glycosyltransferase